VELPLLEHLSVQFFEDRLTIQVTPAAGVAATPAAVELLQRICHHLTRHQILHRVMAPGQQGSPIEAVMIPLPRTG
jgi:hypothetical protein